MKLPRRIISTASSIALALAWSAIGPAFVRADVVVLTNRTSTAVKFAAVCGDAKGQVYEIAAGDLRTLSCRPGDQIRLAYMSAGARHDFALQPNSIYFFHRGKGNDKLELEQISLSEHGDIEAPADAKKPTASRKTANSANTAVAHEPPSLAKVKIKILVDEDEKAVRSAWEERLRKRIADASKIFEKYAGVAFEVVACETWVTDNRFQDFEAQLREFEANVNPAPADLAIGFASQYSAVSGRTHLGGTRGPLSRHILVREWSKHVSEPERLEVLVHELGHHFGAAHSPEPTSVMRPILADRKALAKRFLIVFDPVNALAMNLVAEEIRDHHIERFYQVSPRNRDALVSIYLALGKAFPEDNAAAAYLATLGEAPPVAVRTGHAPAKTFVEGAQRVRDSIVNVADRNRRLSRTSTDGGQVRVTGDALTEKYVRAAAYAAMQLPVAQRPKSFTLGLAVALGDTDMFLSNSLMRDLLASLETPEQRERRLDVIGTPTIRGRNDLARHYFFSAAMAALSSASIAESAGLLKEMRDVKGESGFSFSDIAADLAGIALAEFVKISDEKLPEVARDFSIDKYVPSIDGLRDGLTEKEFVTDYGTTSDPRFKQVLDEIRSRVKELPVYAARAARAHPAHQTSGQR